MEALLLAVLTILALSVSIAAFSITATRARITEPFRDWLRPKSFLLYKLASCPYCLSHWLAAGLAPFCLLEFTSYLVLDFLLTVFLLVGLSALLEGLMMNWLHMQESMIDDLVEENQVLIEAVSLSNEPDMKDTDADPPVVL